jgi:hypothetical protein
MALVRRTTMSPSAPAEGSLGLFPKTLRSRSITRGSLAGFAALAVALGGCGGSSVEVISGGAGGGGGDDTSSGMGGTSVVSTTSGQMAGSGGSTSSGDPCGDPKEDITSMDLGDVVLGEATDFPICARTVGFTAMATAPSQNDIIGVARLKPPSGGSVILNFAMAGHDTAVFGRYGWIGASDPQSDSADAFPVKEGEWSITLGDQDGTLKSAQTTVWSRRTMDGQFHGGAVDVNVFIAPNAASQSYLNAVIDNMFPYAGLEKGTVTFFPLDAGFSTIGSQSEFTNLLKASAGMTSVPALNLFVIGNFGAAFGDAIGIAGGIPGSPMQHGTGMSGVAYEPQGNAQYDASVLRHETGHLAGLFHTTEYAIQETDPLSDTPMCATQTMQSNPDSCPDVSNSMFPIAYGAVAFTEAQELVIHGSMLYRGVLQAGGAPVPPKPTPPIPGAPELLPLEPESQAAILHVTKRADIPLRSGAGSLERVLGGIWCSHGGGDYMALALRIAGSDAPAKLRALALDKEAPELIRRRALKGYVRAAQSSPASRSPAINLAKSVAGDAMMPAALRIAALQALATHDPRAASTAREKILESSQGDHLVRAVALKLDVSAKGSLPAGTTP